MTVHPRVGIGKIDREARYFIMCGGANSWIYLDGGFIIDHIISHHIIHFSCGPFYGPIHDFLFGLGWQKTLTRV